MLTAKTAASATRGRFRMTLKRFAAVAAALLLAEPALAQNICAGFGPQAPRDISVKSGANARVFGLAPGAARMNICDIHTHTNAEHRGPGFSISAGDGEHGGWKCGGIDLTEAELTPVSGPFGEVAPGDTIEVHWVFTTCDAAPAPSLNSCFTEACTNPQLRVESQVFLLVSDAKALDFADYAYDGNVVGGLHQPRALPTGTGAPVVFAGSTTGPSFTQAICSPFQVTWSVRPACAKLDVNSLHAWAADGNVFEETHSHGVRRLVTAPELLAPID